MMIKNTVAALAVYPVSHHVMLTMLLVTVFQAQSTAQEYDLSDLLQAQAVERTFQNSIEKAEPAVVAIARIRNAEKSDMFKKIDPFGIDDATLNPTLNPASPDFIPEEFGTGVLIADPRDRNHKLILTNYHVVRSLVSENTASPDHTSQIYVRFRNRQGCYADILAADQRSDLAVLSPRAKAAGVNISKLPAITIGSTATLKKGSIVMALGNPYAIARDGSVSASWGIVSNISRQPAAHLTDSAVREESANETIHRFGTLLQLDARLNLGASGGALLNLKGQLVGITTALAALDGYEISVGYAIPINESTSRIIASLSNGYEVEYGFLGVEPYTVRPKQMEQLSLEAGQASAAEVIRIFPNSPAQQAGLQKGDLILSVNDYVVEDHRDLIREIGLLGPDIEAEIKLWRPRNRREMTVKVKLGKWPVRDEETIVATRNRHQPWQGLTIDYATSRYKYLSMPLQIPKAVVVTAVTEDSLAYRLGIRNGDFIKRVIGKQKSEVVTTPNEFYQAVKALSAPYKLEMVDGRTVEFPEGN